jgi:hypothetical protein
VKWHRSDCISVSATTTTPTYLSTSSHLMLFTSTSLILNLPMRQQQVMSCVYIAYTPPYLLVYPPLHLLTYSPTHLPTHPPPRPRPNPNPKLSISTDTRCLPTYLPTYLHLFPQPTSHITRCIRLALCRGVCIHPAPGTIITITARSGRHKHKHRHKHSRCAFCVSLQRDRVVSCIALSGLCLFAVAVTVSCRVAVSCRVKSRRAAQAVG